MKKLFNRFMNWFIDTNLFTALFFLIPIVIVVFLFSHITSCYNNNLLEKHDSEIESSLQERIEKAYDEGYSEGKVDGYMDGYERGYEDRDDDGYYEAAARNYRNGYSVGYDNGYADAEAGLEYYDGLPVDDDELPLY